MRVLAQHLAELAELGEVGSQCRMITRHAQNGTRSEERASPSKAAKTLSQSQRVLAYCRGPEDLRMEALTVAVVLNAKHALVPHTESLKCEIRVVSNIMSSQGSLCHMFLPCFPRFLDQTIRLTA